MLRRSLGRLAVGKQSPDLVRYPHSLLTTPAAFVTEEDRKSLLGLQLRRLLGVAQELNSLSLSAPKVKWDARVIALRSGPDKDEYEVYVNPVARGYDEDARTSVAPMHGMWENCVSCGVCAAWVLRPQTIAVEYQDEFGATKQAVLDSMRARLFMHELDHLDGVTMLQRTPSPDFVASVGALQQRHLWNPAFPSMEAHMTPLNTFFNYVTNQVEVPRGFEFLTQLQEAFYRARSRPEIDQQPSA